MLRSSFERISLFGISRFPKPADEVKIRLEKTLRAAASGSSRKRARSEDGVDEE